MTNRQRGIEMEKYVILSDVTCDLTEEMRKYFGVEDYIPGHINLGNGREEVTKLEWNFMTSKEFYKAISDKNSKISTAPPNLEEYYAKFEEYIQKGYAVLSMSISGKISATYDFATTAAKRIKENYPDAKIYCLDSARLSGAFGLLTCYAHQLQKQGKTFEEVIEWLEANKTRVHQMGPIDDLIVVAKRGRVTMGAAIMGTIVGIKPLGDFNDSGYTTVLTKVKGINKAFATTLEYVRETAVDIEDQYVFVMHTDRERYAEDLKERIEKELHPKKVFVGEVFAASGTNIGPGMISVYYMGDHISKDLEKEKAAMDKVIAAK